LGVLNIKHGERFREYDDDVPQLAEEAYNKIADWYSARKRGSYEFKILLPAILNLIGNLRGKSLIDIGCGPGVYSLEFSKIRANVLGLDISRKMLDKARKNAKMTNSKLTLLKTDAHFLPFMGESFDIAILILTILNAKMVQETARVLKPGGLLLFSDTHPIIESKGKWESNGVGAGRIVENYFSQDKREWRIELAPGQTVSLKYYTRTIEQCVNMIVDAGFEILRVAEPKPGRDVEKSDLLHYDRCSRVPYFIVYLAQKPT
jgi:ubiquinone/menaquinone biosynthesis C-methylase UbiE